MNETQTLTISEFLKARYAEEYDAAQDEDHIAWLTFRKPDGQMLYTAVASGEPDDHWVVDGDERTDYASVHLVYDPQRVLEDIMSKRAIVDLHEPWPNRRNTDWIVCSECSGDDDPYLDQVPYPCPTLRLLAAPYRRHADFREEWT